jgi:uncharacterized protein (DUF1015 family)
MRLATVPRQWQHAVARFAYRHAMRPTLLSDVPTVLPFAGLRYVASPGELEALLSPPYDVVEPAEQAQLQARSPHNAIHIELPSDAPGQPGSRYRLAAERLATWRHQGVVAFDPRPAYYFSETQFVYAGQTFQRRDVLAALGVEPWSAGAVLPHEQTMSAPKADRLELLRSTHLNVSPIWVLHRERLPALDQAWSVAEASLPAVELTWRGERHRLWVVDDSALTLAIAEAFERGGPLYIADGHHRYETSLAFRAEAEASVPGARATLAAVTWADDPGLLASPTHRLLHTVDASFTLEAARRRWADLFNVEFLPFGDGATDDEVDALMHRLADSGRSAPSFGVYGLGDPHQFGILQLRDRSLPEGSLPTGHSTAWRALDVSLLHALLVDPLVAETGRPREEVLGYTRHAQQAIAAVRDGRAALAFFLNETPVADVLAVADAHDRMPEKSTFFHPKPPAGVVMRDLEVS